VSSRVIELIEGVKLLDNNAIVMTDHRAYLMDFNLQEYFQDQFSL